MHHAWIRKIWSIINNNNACSRTIDLLSSFQFRAEIPRRRSVPPAGRPLLYSERHMRESSSGNGRNDGRRFDELLSLLIFAVHYCIVQEISSQIRWIIIIFKGRNDADSPVGGTHAPSQIHTQCIIFIHSIDPNFHPSLMSTTRPTSAT